MSALGHKRTFALAKGHVRFTPESGHVRALGHVRFVPIADIATILAFQETYSRQRERGLPKEANVNWPFQKSGQQV